MPIEFNALETERFQVRCAHVIDVDASLDDINRTARNQDIKFLTARISTNNISRAQAFEADGFRIMDTLVYYRLKLENSGDLGSKNHTVKVRRAEHADADAVGEIAAQAFTRFIGHFHTDKRLSPADADAVYVDWAKSSVLSSDNERLVLVAEIDGSLVGFLTADGENGELALNAVRPEAQSRGVYGCLLDSGLQVLRSACCSEATISTQVNNLHVQQAWVGRGFRLYESRHTFHKWLDQEDHGS